MATDRWGIDDGFHDVEGAWHALSDESRVALRGAMGADGLDAPPEPEPLWFVEAGTQPQLRSPCRLVLEDGSDLGVVDRLPPDAPVGWHQLVPAEGPSTTLAIRPSHGYLPDHLRAWMWSTQLYASRSFQSWGMGDLADLAALGRFGRETGAGFIGVNPLFDARTEPTCETSPYFPTSRRWLHPIWLRMEDIEGASATLGGDLAALADAGRALGTERRIDRDAVWALKDAALRLLWERQPRRREHPTFVRWRAEQGDALEEHARYRALAEVHGASWHHWPAELHDPHGAGARAAAGEVRDAVDRWAWVQWLLDQQLADAAAELPILADLPVGVDPSGSDAWRWQHVLAQDVHVGAPPDTLGPNGQDWGAAPFVPWRLRAAHYAPLIEMVRSACQHAGALRIDHVMGLFRLFWIPPGATPAAGGYVRFPANELLDTLLIESVRAGTILVGEDLGTVEGGVRELLADRQVLGTRLVLFEDGPPAALPESCLASISTHDLPTVAGLWTGADAVEAREAGIPVDDSELAVSRARLARAAGTSTDEPDPAAVIAGAVEGLAHSPARLVAVSLDDALAVEERPNLPSTTDAQRPNWSLALPVPIEGLAGHPLVQRCASELRRARPAGPAESA